MVTALRDVGIDCALPRATMYLWVRLPEGMPSAEFARDLLEREGLAVLAGSVFGEGGEGFVRLSFIVEPARLREAAVRMARALDRFGVAKGRA